MTIEGTETRFNDATSYYNELFGPMMTHKYRGSNIVLSISKSVEPNEEQRKWLAVFSKVFSASTEIVVTDSFVIG